jgi:hypothetical protein
MSGIVKSILKCHGARVSIVVEANMLQTVKSQVSDPIR